MSDFGYSKRAKDVEDARAAIDVAFAQVKDRWDDRDPLTVRWKAAIRAFHAAQQRVFVGQLGEFSRGERDVGEIDTADILDYLEADPMFFGSGYMKEKLLSETKRRELSAAEAKRFQEIILEVVQKADSRREFRNYCRAAVSVDNPEFRERIISLEMGDEPAVALRANWLLAALNGKFEELARASRIIFPQDRTIEKKWIDRSA